MTVYKIIALILIFLTPAASQIIISSVGLKRRFYLSMADIAFPLFAYEIILVSSRFFTHSFLFYYLLVLSGLALILVLFLLHKSRVFSFKRWGKFFWRTGFLLTFVFYIGTVISIFLQ